MMILAFIAFVSSFEDFKAKFGDKQKDMTKEITISSINKNKWENFSFHASKPLLDLSFCYFYKTKFKTPTMPSSIN